jgi:hypothetical protein
MFMRASRGWSDEKLDKSWPQKARKYKRGTFAQRRNEIGSCLNGLLGRYSTHEYCC